MDKFKEVCALSCDDWLDGFSQSYEYEFSDSFNKNMQKLADRMRNDKYHVFTRKAVYALIIAAVILSFATTAFANSSSRKFIIEQFKEHFSYSVSEIDKIGTVESINVGYLPNKFEKVDEYVSEAEILQVYANNNYWLNIDKSSVDFSVNIDISDKEVRIINDTEYLVFTTDSTNGVIWNNGIYIYTVSGNIDKEELVKIALEID